MENTHTNSKVSNGKTLITGATGKIGRRVTASLAARGIDTRVVSRSTDPAFDWNDTSTWDAALEDIGTAYIAYAPDLAIPGATDRSGHLSTKPSPLE